MLKHIIRIGPDVLRLPLLVLAALVCWPATFLRHAMPARWGGHPNKRRLLCADYWAMYSWAFWAAWDGRFVP